MYAIDAARFKHRDVYHLDATWCNEAGLCANLTSRTTFVDLVSPIVAGFFGSSLHVEAPSTGPLRFQHLNDVSFTVTQTFDADSYVAFLDASIQAVGDSADAAAAAACVNASAADDIVHTVKDWTAISVPNNSELPGMHEYILAQDLDHDTVYRVALRATDAAGNVLVQFTQCVVVDKTPAVAAFDPLPDRDLVTGANGGSYYLDAGGPRSMDVTGVAENDVSGVSDVFFCCGTYPQSCDLALRNVTITRSDNESVASMVRKVLLSLSSNAIRCRAVP